MKSVLAIIALATLALAVVPAVADTFSPTPANLNDLPHDQYFTWGIAPGAGSVSWAKLTFNNIYDWAAEPNTLYVHLLNTAPLGITSYTDNEGGGDNFAGQGISLVTYTNLPTTPQTLVYNFTADQVATLNQYIGSNGDFALALDPDCHYYNDGVSLQVGYCPVPEPGTAVLILLGAGGLLAKRFRRRAH